MTKLSSFTRKLATTLAALVCLGSAAQAQTVTGSFTSDNAYSVWTGTATAAITNVVPSTYNTLNIQIRQGERFSFDYKRGCNIYIATWSDIKDYQGLVGSFTGGVTIKTGDPQIQVAPSGIPKNSTNFPTLAEINAVIASNSWVAPFIGPTVTAGVTLPPFSSNYSTLSVPGLDPNAKWVWYNSGKDSRGLWSPTAVSPNFVPFIAFDHGEFLLWRIPCDGLVPKQTLTIKKTVIGAGATFNYTTSGTGLSNFTLSPASNSTDTKVFNNLSPGSFSVTETALAGYTLTSLTCTGDKDNGNVIDQANGTVKIDLDDGEHQVCTFVNTADKPPPEPTGCLADIKAAVKCNGDGTYTVTLSGSSFSGTAITLASETSGVTVSPPQQAWAPTTTWTISGATAGQTVKLMANATKTGGGTQPGTDLCCSTELTLVMPECPPNDGVVYAKKEVVSKVQGYPAPPMTFPVNVNCSNGTSATLNLASNGTPQSVGNLPIGASCTFSEPTVTNNACPAGMTTVWDAPIYSPSNTAIAANPGPTVTVTNRFDCKPGDTGTLAVKKVVISKLPIILSTANFPITVTCPSSSYNLSVSSDGTPQVVNNIPAPSTCQVSEDTSNLPNVCPDGTTPTWDLPNISPSSVPITAGQTALVTITNTVRCGEGDDKGYLRVEKHIDRGDVNLPLQQLTSLSFPMTATCDGTPYPVNVSMLSPGIITGIPANATCTVSETLPPPPANGCPVGQTPMWVNSPAFSPANVTIVPGQGPVINVTNKLMCMGRITPPPPPPACLPPLVPDPKGGCMCPGGHPPIDGKCVSPPPPKCKPPMVLDPATGGCTCPAGMRKEGNRCVRRVFCQPPARLNKRGTGCDCPKDMTKRGNTCVRREKPRKRVPTDDVLRALPGMIGNGVFRGGNGGGDNGGGHRGGGAGDGGGKGVR